MSDLYSAPVEAGKVYDADGKDFNIFPGPGFVENNVIESVKVEKDKNQNDYLKITFKNIDTGATLAMMEFAVTDDGKKTKEELAKKMDSQMKRLKHVMSKFYGDSIPTYGTFEAIRNGIRSFGELATRIAQLLPANVLATKKFRVFVNYNYKNYISLPSFVPFMEDGAIAPADSKMIPQIEKTLKQSTMYKMEKDKTTTTNPQDLDFGLINGQAVQEFTIPSGPADDSLPF